MMFYHSVHIWPPPPPPTVHYNHLMSRDVIQKLYQYILFIVCFYVHTPREQYSQKESCIKDLETIGWKSSRLFHLKGILLRTLFSHEHLRYLYSFLICALNQTLFTKYLQKCANLLGWQWLVWTINFFTKRFFLGVICPGYNFGSD